MEYQDDDIIFAFLAQKYLSSMTFKPEGERVEIKAELWKCSQAQVVGGLQVVGGDRYFVKLMFQDDVQEDAYVITNVRIYEYKEFKKLNRSYGNRFRGKELSGDEMDKLERYFDGKPVRGMVSLDEYWEETGIDNFGKYEKMVRDIINLNLTRLYVPSLKLTRSVWMEHVGGKMHANCRRCRQQISALDCQIWWKNYKKPADLDNLRPICYYCKFGWVQI